jgi:hypothetical protein
MDRKELVTIAVTAAITFTVTECIKWLGRLAKISAARTVTKEKAKKIFSKNNRAIMFDCLWIISCIVSLVAVMRKSTPITRLDVLGIVTFSVFTLLAIVALMWDIIGLRLSRQRERGL